jgi:UDP-N-acetylglucosamine 3-dehydrogenase
MTRIAVVGVGTMGKNHVRVCQEMPEVELVALADKDHVAVEKIGRMYHVPAYSDYQEMLKREKPEAVIIAVPTYFHFDVASYFLSAGCHVLIEKPIAATLEEAQELVTQAEKNGRVLMVGHIERYNPAIIELKKHLEWGELGRVFQIHARRLGPFPPRIQDVGVVMDLATHDLDIMRYLIGSDVLRLFAEANREVHASCEDLFVGTLRFANATVGLLEINWLTPTKIRELYVTGERGMFRVNYITQDLCFFENAETNGEGWSTLSLLRGVSEGSMVQYAIKKKEPLRTELEAFVARLENSAIPIIDGRDAQVALMLAMALVNSANTGRVWEVTGDERSGFSTDVLPSRVRESTAVTLPASQTNI